eukprot:357383-Pleurochrysis_carterae.AAC.1
MTTEEEMAEGRVFPSIKSIRECRSAKASNARTRKQYAHTQVGTRARTRTSTHARTQARTHTHTRTRTHARTFIHAHVRARARALTCTRTRVCVRACANAHLSTRAYIPMHMPRARQLRCARANLHALQEAFWRFSRARA